MKKKLWYSVDSDNYCNLTEVKPVKDSRNDWQLPEESEEELLVIFSEAERMLFELPENTPNNEPVEVYVSFEFAN